MILFLCPSQEPLVPNVITTMHTTGQSKQDEEMKALQSFTDAQSVNTLGGIMVDSKVHDSELTYL